MTIHAFVPRPWLQGDAWHHPNVHGMFSFINMVASIQEMFAQSINNILSMVTQEKQLSIECADEGMLVMAIKASSYASRAHIEGCCGFIEGVLVMAIKVGSTRSYNASTTSSAAEQQVR